MDSNSTVSTNVREDGRQKKLRFSYKSIVIGALVILVVSLLSILRKLSYDNAVYTDETVLHTVQQLEMLNTAKMEIHVMVDYNAYQYRFLRSDNELDIWTFMGSTVRAGIDLSEIQEQDVLVYNIKGQQTLIVNLPHAEITGITSPIRLQPDWLFDVSGIYEDLGLRQNTMNRILESVPDSMTALAVQYGLLERADENVRNAVIGLATSLGYSNVIVQYQPNDAYMNVLHRRN